MLNFFVDDRNFSLHVLRVSLYHLLRFITKPIRRLNEVTFQGLSSFCSCMCNGQLLMDEILFVVSFLFPLVQDYVLSSMK